MTTPSNPSVADFFTHDHRACDEAWAAVEAAAGQGDVGTAWPAFQRLMLRHLDWEEQVMFPAFEGATGMHGMGPTEVMRSEHLGMRGLLDQMGQAVAEGDLDELLDQGDTLLMMIQQHNMKEEQVLYPMMSQVLAGAWPHLRARLGG